MKIIDVEQGSLEWFEARKLKMTASKATAIANQGAGLKTLILELCSEYLSTQEKEHFSNAHTDRGNELEGEARNIYELETGNEVLEVGFVEHSKYVGMSPDGFVLDDGLTEFKCKSDANHLKQAINGIKGIESGHVWQMQMQMLISKRSWCDYVCYNPNLKRSLLIYRIEADKDKHEKLLSGFKLGEKMIVETLNKYEGVK